MEQQNTKQFINARLVYFCSVTARFTQGFPRLSRVKKLGQVDASAGSSWPVLAMVSGQKIHPAPPAKCSAWAQWGRCFSRKVVASFPKRKGDLFCFAPPRSAVRWSCVWCLLLAGCAGGSLRCLCPLPLLWGTHPPFFGVALLGFAVTGRLLNHVQTGNERKLELTGGVLLSC